MMTDTTTAAEAGPRLLTRGRFALTEMPDGSLVVTRAAPLCATCEGCGCGEQEEPIHVPALLVSLMKAHADGRRPGLGQMRRLLSMAAGGLATGELDGPGDG
jgi:hypothetical protein